MKYRRNFISLSIALIFVVISLTGILLFSTAHNKIVLNLHSIFGFAFIFTILWHIFNNKYSLIKYIKSRIFLVAIAFVCIVFYCVYVGITPVQNLMDWSARQKVKDANNKSLSDIEVYQMNEQGDYSLSIDLLAGRFFWYPQIAIWLEDQNGGFIQTIFVTHSTAKGEFYGGRTKKNFKKIDKAALSKTAELVKVNALPVWSYRMIEKDLVNTPDQDHPIPDAISGATPSSHFRLQSKFDKAGPFKVFVEINVAFDDNEYYSEFDFPDDEIYHSGTGQLGQPAIVYTADIDLEDGQDYYFMEIAGHGHYSGRNGTLYPDISSLTSALQIAERIVLGYKIEQGEF